MTTETLRFALVALSLVVLTCLASDPKSATDQYLTRHDQSHPFRPLDEALKAVNSRHRFDLKQKKSQDEYPSNNDIVPDLQVGCGDGLLLETSTTPRPPIPEYKKLHARQERRKREAGARKPRDYLAYTVYTPSSFSYSVWKSQPYKIERPYYIPIWGSHGRLPIYFPPQSIFVNPGFPLDNPPRKDYLPPTTQTPPTTEPESTVTIRDRFGDEPVWDMRPVDTSTTLRPTSKPSTSTFPPLIHNINPESGTSSSVSTTTVRSPSVEYSPENNVGNSFQPEIANPLAAPSDSVPSAPTAPATTPCGWAIINCCSASSTSVSNSCFERLGCPGPFWDKSPCDSDFAKNAIKMALEYYQSRLH